ncbi:MAG: DNA repair protein RecO [Bacteroidales bacterium]|nr:DNA repair protein RecO [Bacteroidales bacterium]
MPLNRKSQLIVLHLTKYSDSGMIVNAIDSSVGRCGFFLKGVGRNKSALLANFHSLSILEAVIQASPKSDLHYLKEYSPVYSLSALRSDPVKSSIALFISEVLYRSLFEISMDAKLFDWLCDTIKLLNDTDTSVANFHPWFLVGLCSKMGFHPQSNYSDTNRIFQITTENFIPDDSYSRSLEDTFSAELSYVLHRFLTSPFGEAMELQLSGTQRNAFSLKMLEYLSYHLGINIRVKSLAVLHDIFANFV